MKAMKSWTMAAGLLVGLAGVMPAAAMSSSVPTATLANGQMLMGVYQQTGVFDPSIGITQAFLGIPFAQPPLGSLRFNDAAPPSVNQTLFSGSINNANVSAGPVECLYVGNGTGMAGVEDCLYLDVWMPETATPSSNLPVYVYIPGGGFYETIYIPGSEIVGSSQNFVYVTMNYRLGPFGYFASYGTQLEHQPIQYSGNWAMSDLVMALVWVKENIAAFGGNPDNVTIGGESAGSINVCYLLQSPKASGYFHRAILESGGCDETNAQIRTNYPQSLQLAGLAGCTQTNSTEQLECLRNVDGLTLNELYYQMQPAPYGTALFTFSAGLLRPVVDGYWISQFPSVSFSTGSWNQVPLLLSNCNDEATLWARSDPLFAPGNVTYSLALDYVLNYTVIKEKHVNDSNSADFAAVEDQIIAIENFYVNYFQEKYGSVIGPFMSAINILSASIFQCPLVRLGKYAQAQGFSVHYSDFSYQSNDSRISPEAAFQQKYALMNITIPPLSEHASELVFVYVPLTDLYPGKGSLYNIEDTHPNALNLSHVMMQFWENFIVTGDPNTIDVTSTNYLNESGLIHWPQFVLDADTTQNIQFGSLYNDNNVSVSIAQNTFAPSCAVLEPFVYNYTYVPNCVPGYVPNADNTACEVSAAAAVTYSTTMSPTKSPSGFAHIWSTTSLSLTVILSLVLSFY